MRRDSNPDFLRDLMRRPCLPTSIFASGLLFPFDLREEDARRPHQQCKVSHRPADFDRITPPIDLDGIEQLVGIEQVQCVDQFLAAYAHRQQLLEAATHSFEITPFELIQHKRCPVCSEEVSTWWTSDDACDGIGFRLYRSIVMSLSRWSHRVFNDPTHSRIQKANQGQYHLDHRVSLFTAFPARIPEWVVAAPFNLQWITGSENSVKGTRDEFSVDELQRRYQIFESNGIWQSMLERYRKTGSVAGDEVNRLPRRVPLVDRQQHILATMEPVAELWKSGMSITGMALYLGWSRPTMTYRLRRHRELIDDSWVHTPHNEGQRLPR